MRANKTSTRHFERRICGAGARPAAALRALLRALLVGAVLLRPGHVAGQGLPTQPSAEGAAAAAHARWRLHYARAAVWKAAYRRSPAAACNGAAAASPCYQASPKQGGPRAPADSEAVLSIATAPGYYSSLDPRSTGGVRVLGPPRDQRPCSTCAAFAAVAAAEAAVARATGRDAAAAGGGGLSVQDLHMCGPVPRTCYTSWSIKGALDALQARPLLLERCLPFSGAASEGKSPDALCARARRCSDRDAAAVLGGWEVAPLADAWQVQRHIRDWGAVVTRFEIYSDFRGFYEVRANARKAYSPRKGAAFQEGHAVALVGYSNAPDGGGFWIARNSWGPDFVDGVNFRAREGDYISSVARRAGIPTAALLLANTAAVSDLDAPLAGKALAICGGTAGGGGGDPRELQLRALLDLKRAVDRTGLLKNWTAESGRGGGYCKWQEMNDPGPATYPGGPDKAPYMMAVFCDEDGNVEQIGLRGGALGGTLPGAAALARLPRLTQLVLGNASLSGALPDGWGALTGLKVLAVIGGDGGAGGGGGRITGSLPAAWGNLKRLEHFTLSATGVEGTLPPEISWPDLFFLEISANNGLRGPLPDSWAASMTQLKYVRIMSNPQLSGTLPAVLNWRKAESIQASGNAFSGPIPAAWTTLPVLQNLMLQENQLTGPLPQRVTPALRAFLGSQNQLSGTLPPQWASARNLTHFGVRSNRLKGTLPPEWGTSWTSAKGMNLIENMLTGTIPATWEGMRELTYLNLDDNKLEGPLPLFSWPRLTQISWNKNKLRGTLPASWGAGMPSMEGVFLGDNLLSGTLPPEWGYWASIKQVHLHRNRLEGTVPASWGRMGATLDDVALFNNSALRGCIPPGLRKFEAWMIQYSDALSPAFGGTGLTSRGCG